jgi:hypothetical protein
MPRLGKSIASNATVYYTENTDAGRQLLMLSPWEEVHPLGTPEAQIPILCTSSKIGGTL